MQKDRAGGAVPRGPEKRARSMKIFRGTTPAWALLVVSAITTLALLAAAYEIVSSLRYDRWKRGFDVIGWLTVPSPNSVLMWEYRPYGHWREFAFNRYGFRDRDYESTEKASNTHRVAFIGDSVTLGLFTPIEDTFVTRFETAANQLGLGHAVQALNFSVDGYNAPQIYEMLRTKTLEFHPDKVVYMLCLNDFDFEDSSGYKIQYFRKPTSFLLRDLERVYRNRVYMRLGGGDFHGYYFRKNRKRAFEAILDMNTVLTQKGVRFVVAVLPVFPDAAPDFTDYPVRDMHREIAAFLNEHRIHHVDLLDAFAQQQRPPKSFAHDIWHPNAEGHLLIARHLLQPILGPTGDHAVAPLDHESRQ